VCLGWISLKVQWIVGDFFKKKQKNQKKKPNQPQSQKNTHKQPTNKKPEGENVLASIEEKDVLSKVAVLFWRNFCCCAGRRRSVTSSFMCLVLSCHLFVPPFHCSTEQASERVEMTQFGNAGCHYWCCGGDQTSAGARKKLFCKRSLEVR